MPEETGTVEIRRTLTTVQHTFVEGGKTVDRAGTLTPLLASPRRIGEVSLFEPLLQNIWSVMTSGSMLRRNN